MSSGTCPFVRERRHRLSRDAYVGEVVAAFTASVAGRQPLFTDAHVVGVFAGLLGDAARRHASTVLLYCFMPDHLHLVLRGSTPQSDLWRAMLAFKQQSGFWLSKNSAGARWQKDFYDRVIRRDEDLTAELRYIAFNPVRGGLVGDWADYPFLGSDTLDLRDLIGAA